MGWNLFQKDFGWRQPSSPTSDVALPGCVSGDGFSTAAAQVHRPTMDYHGPSTETQMLSRTAGKIVATSKLSCSNVCMQLLGFCFVCIVKEKTQFLFSQLRIVPEVLRHLAFPVAFLTLHC